MTTIKKLLKENNVNITIPTIWQEKEVDNELKYTYHTETQDGNTIHVLRTKGYDRAGNTGYDDIIIDPTQNLLTFIRADGVMTQYDEKGEITNSTV